MYVLYVHFLFLFRRSLTISDISPPQTEISLTLYFHIFMVDRNYDVILFEIDIL